MVEAAELALPLLRQQRPTTASSSSSADDASRPATQMRQWVPNATGPASQAINCNRQLQQFDRPSFALAAAGSAVAAQEWSPLSGSTACSSAPRGTVSAFNGGFSAGGFAFADQHRRVSAVACASAERREAGASLAAAAAAEGSPFRLALVTDDFGSPVSVSRPDSGSPTRMCPDTTAGCGRFKMDFNTAATSGHAAPVASAHFGMASPLNLSPLADGSPWRQSDSIHAADHATVAAAGAQHCTQQHIPLLPHSNIDGASSRSIDRATDGSTDLWESLTVRDAKRSRGNSMEWNA